MKYTFNKKLEDINSRKETSNNNLISRDAKKDESIKNHKIKIIKYVSEKGNK